MTTRLYYQEPERRAFDATVLACELREERHDVILDRTAFYPTSGGQPHDTGRLAGVAVLDVFERDDGTIVHVMDGPVEVGARVSGDIDWSRRLDHMQQHTGQHVLSAVLDRLFDVRTLSFHLGAEVSTIDLAREIDQEQIAAVEAEANRVVRESRPVTIRFVTEAEAATLPLRKEPVRSGELRLIEIADVDLSACGGTHVPQTGAIGMIAVTAWERFKGGTRLSFACGGRALLSHGLLRDVVAASTRLLSVAVGDLETTIARLQAQEKEHAREIRRLAQELSGYRAASARADAETTGSLRGVLRHEPDADGVVLRTLASAIVSEPGFVAVLAGDGEPAPVVVARAADLTVDAGALIKSLVAEFGGRGGGRPELAQGGIAAPAADVLAFSRRTLTAMLS